MEPILGSVCIPRPVSSTRSISELAMRKGGSEDEAESMRPDCVHDGSSNRDVAAKSAVSHGKRSLNHVDPLHDAVALSVPTSVSVGSSEQEIIEHASPISTTEIEART